MIELVVAMFSMFAGFVTGTALVADNYQEKCVAKYAEMPHNQVGDYCKKILKFEKDTK